MALSLIINEGGFASIADKDKNVRWGNCSIFEASFDDDDLSGCYSKYFRDARGSSPDFEYYYTLLFEPLIKWSEECSIE